MRKMRKKSILLLTVMMVSILAGSITVYAKEPFSSAQQTDTAGNEFINDKSVTGGEFSEDVYWVGNEMSMNDVKIDSDLLAAGYTLVVNGAKVDGSVRTGSYSVKLKDVTVAHNITSAGNTVNIGDGTKAKGVYVAGNDITFSGECDALAAAGNMIVLDGVVNGDADLSGNKITIGPNAVVTGKLTVTASNESDIPDSAQISEYSYVETPDVPDEEAIEAASEGAHFLHKVLNRVYWIPAMIVVALFFCLAIPGAVDGSGKMLLAKPVAMPVTGLITLCAIPVALIILCITFIGLPLAGLIALLAAIAAIFAVPFTGASAGRLVLPKMNVWLSSIIGAAVLTLILAIPFIGGLVKFLSIIYVLGYFILKCYEQLQTLGKKPAQKTAEPVVEAAVETAAETQENQQ